MERRCPVRTVPVAPLSHRGPGYLRPQLLQSPWLTPKHAIVHLEQPPRLDARPAWMLQQTRDRVPEVLGHGLKVQVAAHLHAEGFDAALGLVPALERGTYDALLARISSVGRERRWVSRASWILTLSLLITLDAVYTRHHLKRTRDGLLQRHAPAHRPPFGEGRRVKLGSGTGY